MYKLPKNTKEIPGFPEYGITLNGKVWSKHHHRFIKSHITVWGYLQISLYRNRTRYKKAIHRLVLETYIGLCPKGMECCHKNDIRTDNRLDNLRWDTKSENHLEAYRNGRQSIKGEQNGRAKLNALQVRVIRRLLESGGIMQKEIGEIFNVTQPAISNIKNSQNWGLYFK